MTGLVVVPREEMPIPSPGDELLRKDKTRTYVARGMALLIKRLHFRVIGDDGRTYVVKQHAFDIWIEVTDAK